MTSRSRGPAQPAGAYRRGTALITGASAGLGEEFAWQLAAAGHDLVIVARREERLAQLAHDIEQAAGVKVEVLAADLATADGRAKVVGRITDRQSAPIGLLINNAGFGLGQPFISGDIERENQAIEVMIRAVMELSHAAANEMVTRGRGAILNVASMVSQTAMGTYAAAKAWVRTFTEALAGELRGTGVTATAVSPGLVRTEFHSSSGMKEEAWPEIGWLDAEDVVADALAAVRRGAVLTTPSLRYKAVQGIIKLAPRAAVRALGGPRMWEKAIPSNRQPVTGTLADLLEREGNDLTAEESAVLSPISAADPSEGAWLQEAIGERFGLAPADLLGPNFERYVQVRFPVDKAWINEKDGWTWGGEVPPWEDPFPELYDEAPSLDPADWEQVYQRVGGLNPSQLSALMEHLATPEGEVIAGFWHGYSGLTSGDDETFIERIGNRFRSAVSRLVAPDAPADDDADLADSQAIAEGLRQANLRLLPQALRDGPTLELPDREHILLRFGSLADLVNYLEWLEPYSWHPNLVWPVDRSWAYAIDVDSGSLLLGCDAQLAETLIADKRLYAEPIDAETQGLGDTDHGDPAIDPIIEDRSELD